MPCRRSSPVAFTLWVIAILSLLTGCQGSEGQLIRRWDFHAGDRERSIEIPVHLDADLPKRVGRYRLTTRVAVDAELRGHELDLTIPSLPAQVVLRVDGKEIPPADKLALADRPRHIGPHRWTLPKDAVQDGALTLELDVLHNWTQSAWVDVAPRLIPSGTETPVLRRNRLFNDRGGWFGLIGLSQMGATFLAVYFWDRRRRAYLWFAIQGLSASYYPAYALGVLTDFSLHLETLLLAQCLSIATVISIYYTHALFELGKPHRLWAVLMVVAFFTPTPAIFAPFVDSSYGTPGVVLCVGTTIVYQLHTGVRLLSRYPDRRIVLFFVCCWLALGGSAWVDLWAWIGGGEVLDGARPACIGLGLFGMFQSMLLSRSHFRSLQEADGLNAMLRGRLSDLEARQTEIQALNEELRQQVGRRSAHILAALAGPGGPSGAVHLEPGDVIEDRYRVIGALGSGGMGTVYEVERLHDRRRLALKVTLETRGLALARLAREAQLATRVRHPNVVAVVDTDVAKGGYVYLVMDLVDGCSLADREGQHDARWCLNVLVQILEGVRALHAQGIIHRDLKPGNVLLSGDFDREPTVKITDFGISRGFGDPEDTPPPAQRPPKTLEPATVRMNAKQHSQPDATDDDLESERPPAPPHTPSASTPQLTRTGAISGTPSYIAPELARASAAITPAVDVFSFGVVAYRLFTGNPPHAEAPLLARLDGREPAPHAPLVVAGLPRRAARLVEACLSFTPEGRPGTMELLRVLWEALEDTKRTVRNADPVTQ